MLSCGLPHTWSVKLKSELLSAYASNILGQSGTQGQHMFKIDRFFLFSEKAVKVWASLFPSPAVMDVFFVDGNTSLATFLEDEFIN